jgi:hypothetical protein
MIIKIVNKVKGPRVLPCDEKRQLLKSKIFKMTNERTNHDTIKNKSIVPKDLLNEYLALKKHKLRQSLTDQSWSSPMELHDPSKVLSKPEEYRNIIHTMVKSFGMYKGNNNPVINYYRSLEKHLEEKTQTPIINNTKSDVLPEVTKDFISKLQLDRNSIPKEEIDEDMRKIYESMGINPDKTD